MAEPRDATPLDLEDWLDKYKEPQNELVELEEQPEVDITIELDQLELEARDPAPLELEDQLAFELERDVVTGLERLEMETADPAPLELEDRLDIEEELGRELVVVADIEPGRFEEEDEEVEVVDAGPQS